MKKNDLKYIICWIMYFVSFVVYLVFMKLANGISNEAWLYAMGASIGISILALSGYLRK